MNRLGPGGRAARATPQSEVRPRLVMRALALVQAVYALPQPPSWDVVQAAHELRLVIQRRVR